jgi:hypothetical protein
MTQFFPHWLHLYIKKIKLRNSRMPGFIFSFIVPRFLKAIVAIPLILFLLFYYRIKKINTVIYRPDSRHLKFFINKKNILIIGNTSDFVWAWKNKMNFVFFYPFYISSHLGISILWKIFLYKIIPKRLIVWSDYGLDQFIALYYCKQLGITSWCFQHGLMPSQNNNDLDGISADINIVASLQQLKIFRKSDYLGKLIVNSNLFKINTNHNFISRKKNWISGGVNIIFVGAGYIYNEEYEKNIVLLILQIKKLLEPSYNLIYRPHPRDKTILKKLNSLKIDCISTYKTSFENPQNFIYIGVKSTYLLEAQNANCISFLILDKSFPKFFEPNEIRFEIPLIDIKLLKMHLDKLRYS